MNFNNKEFDECFKTGNKLILKNLFEKYGKEQYEMGVANATALLKKLNSLRVGQLIDHEGTVFKIQKVKEKNGIESYHCVKLRELSALNFSKWYEVGMAQWYKNQKIKRVKRNLTAQNMGTSMHKKLIEIVMRKYDFK